MTDERKKTTISKKKIAPANDLIERLRTASEGLYYISETDAPIVPFAGGRARAVDSETLLEQINQSADSPVEERDFEELFARLKRVQDWYGKEEKRNAQRFARLEELLRDNLKDLKVFKVGRINLDVYVVGLSADGTLAGIRTKAVET